MLSTLIKYTTGEKSKLRFKLDGMAGELTAVATEAVEKLLAKCDDDRLTAVILLASEAGLRAAEIRGLQWTDIKSGQITVRRTLDKLTNEPVAPKHNKSRTVPMPGRLAAALASLPRRGLWVVAEADGSPITYDRMIETVQAFYKRAGVARPPKALHCLRHTFGTVMAAGAPAAHGARGRPDDASLHRRGRGRQARGNRAGVWAGRASHAQAGRRSREGNRLTLRNFGVNDGGRTRDIQDHNLALYRLSYIHRESTLSTRDARRLQRHGIVVGVRVVGLLVIAMGCGKGDSAPPAPPPVKGVLVTAKGLLLDGAPVGLAAVTRQDLTYTPDAPADAILAALGVIERASVAPIRISVRGDDGAIRPVCTTQWPPRAYEQKSEISILVSPTEVAVGITRFNDVELIDPPFDRFVEVIEARRQSQALASREDAELAAKPGVTGATLTPILAALCARFPEIRAVEPDGLSAKLDLGNGNSHLPSPGPASATISQAKVVGPADRITVRREVRRVLHACELVDAEITFLIQPDGSVPRADVQPANPCMEGALATLRFPPQAMQSDVRLQVRSPRAAPP